MPNLEVKIRNHNKAILSSPSGFNNDEKQCNSRNKPECPLDGHCPMNVIYQATVVRQVDRDLYWIN